MIGKIAKMIVWSAFVVVSIRMTVWLKGTDTLDIALVCGFSSAAILIISACRIVEIWVKKKVIK